MDLQIAGKLYKAMVQAVLLYGLETWVHSKYHQCCLEPFHQRIAQYLCLDKGAWSKD